MCRTKLDYDVWVDLHIDELCIKFAETGADRELDFNLESALESEYNKYLKS